MASNGAVGRGHSQVIAALAGCGAIGYSLTRQAKDDEDGSFIVHLVHLGAFSVWFGSQIWHSFVAAPTMFANMSRQSFGQLQAKLFPKYFKLGIVLCAIVIATHVLENPYGSWDAPELMHMSILGAGFMALLANALLLTPFNMSVMEELFEVEAQAGINDALRAKNDYSKVEKDQRWKQLRFQFKVVHGLSSLGNLLSVLASIFHLYKLAGHIEEI